MICKHNDFSPYSQNVTVTTKNARNKRFCAFSFALTCHTFCSAFFFRSSVARTQNTELVRIRMFPYRFYLSYDSLGPRLAIITQLIAFVSVLFAVARPHKGHKSDTTVNKINELLAVYQYRELNRLEKNHTKKGHRVSFVSASR